jgi:dATP pyrophosphohydrolase
VTAAPGSNEAPFKRPESVLVVVYTRARECLLLERTAPKGFWQSVTGSLRWGETPAQCAARELDEETALPSTTLRDARVAREFPILPAWRARYAPGWTGLRPSLGSRFRRGRIRSTGGARG